MKYLSLACPQMAADQRVLYAVTEAIQRLGYSTMKPEQLQVVSGIVSGRDVFAVLLTGFGKSLCYTCPATVFGLVLPVEGTSIVFAVTFFGVIQGKSQFERVCLDPDVLQTALVLLANVRFHSYNQPIQNKTNRLAAYRQFTYWIHSRLGRHVRRVIPACVINQVRLMYPEPSGEYIGYQEPLNVDT